MKRFALPGKLSIQLILAIILSFFVSIGSFLGLLSILGRYLIFNKGSNICFLSYGAFFIVAIVPIGIFIIIFLILVRKKVNYIKYISEQVNNITKDDFEINMNVVGNDEIAELCKNINYMSMEIKESFEHKRQIENEQSKMITSISHDLRAPIAAIIEYLYILKNKKYNSKEEENENIRVAYNMSIKLNKLINELFEYTKLSSKNIELNLAEVDLGFMLIKILEEYTPRFEEMGLQISVDINGESLVKMDYKKLAEAFNNIFGYVEKYSDLLSELIIKVENKADMAHISISNKSKNLADDKLNSMLENINKIDILKSMDFEESELSLGISKKVIELHHGQLWTEENENIKTIHIQIPTIHKKA